MKRKNEQNRTKCIEQSLEDRGIDWVPFQLDE